MIIKPLSENNVEEFTKFFINSDSLSIKDISSSKKLINDINSIIKRYLNHKGNGELFIYALYDEKDIKLALVIDSDGKIINLSISDTLSVAEGKAFMKEFAKLFKDKNFKYFRIDVKDNCISFLNDIGFKSSTFSNGNSIGDSHSHYFFTLKYYIVSWAFLFIP